MTLGQLAKRLRREATANPKKAALLGLALAVAVYFWAPLVWGWLPSSRKSAGKMEDPAKQGRPYASSGGIASRNDVKAAESPAAPVLEKWPWDQLLAGIAVDGRMKPAGPSSQGRDPFAGAGGKRERDSRDDELPAATPEALGLVLTGTVVGPRSRAVLAGTTVKLGAIVECDVRGQAVRFQLVEVHPRWVVLERDGIRYPLKIADPDAARIELVHTTP